MCQKIQTYLLISLLSSRPCEIRTEEGRWLVIDTYVTLLCLCCRVCFGPQESHLQRGVGVSAAISSACYPATVHTRCFRGRRNHGHSVHRWYIMLLRWKKNAFRTLTLFSDIRECILIKAIIWSFIKMCLQHVALSHVEAVTPWEIPSSIEIF